MSSHNDIATLTSIVRSMQQAHRDAGPADAALRRDRLERAVRLILDNHQALASAMSDDFGHRSAYQSLVADVATTVKSLRCAIDHLAGWMSPETVEPPLSGMTTEIQRQALGVVGVISPWNFPINLAFGPLAGVFAAGNVALLKPSELTPRTSQLLAELVGRYFSPMELGVVLGDAEVGAAFSALPFDHLVFTGSSAVGRHVMRAASANLVPVTLELGGKSPVVVAPDADIVVAAERTMTVKTFNAGQICVSPDYVMMSAARIDAFAAAARSFVARALPTIQANPDYTAIVSPRHYERLTALIDDAREKGAQIAPLSPTGEPALDPKTRKIGPTLILGATDAMRVMQEEIFGPLLPIRAYADLDEAIGYINAHPKPLAAYYFGEDPDLRADFAARTTSGALVFDDVMTHVSIETLPFGGVGASGMGAYHGKHGFERFSHARPVVTQALDGGAGLRLRAPYADKIDALRAALV